MMASFCFVFCFKDHYDWGLRAIKSVLVVAGSLKRSDPGRPEDQVTLIFDNFFSCTESCSHVHCCKFAFEIYRM